jgi:hypothetical protein
MKNHGNEAMLTTAIANLVGGLTKEILALLTDHFPHFRDRQLTLACTGRTGKLWLRFNEICRR